MSSCKTKQELGATYVIEADLFSQAVVDLKHEMATCSKTFYESLLELTEETRRRMEIARMELERHTSEHGC
jgi:hypothetical protein